MRDEYVDVIQDGTQCQMVRGLFQYDHGIKLRIHGQDITKLWQMQYACGSVVEAITVFSTDEDGVIVAAIPDELLMQPREIVCYIYLEENDTGVTCYQIYLPIIQRVKPQAGTYTPEQIDNFNTLVTQFNALIDDIDDLNTESQTINTGQQAELDRLSASNFYVDPTDGNLYLEELV